VFKSFEQAMRDRRSQVLIAQSKEEVVNRLGEWLQNREILIESEWIFLNS